MLNWLLVRKLSLTAYLITLGTKDDLVPIKPLRTKNFVHFSKLNWVLPAIKSVLYNGSKNVFLKDQIPEIPMCQKMPCPILNVNTGGVAIS